MPFFRVLLCLLLLTGCDVLLPPAPPVPTPFVPPVVVGSKFVLIVTETSQQTPEFARLRTALQSGETAKQLAGAGHVVEVLDQDAKTSEGQPLPLLQRLRATIGNKPLPVLIVGTQAPAGAFGEPLLCESLAKETTLPQLLERLQRAGVK